MARLDIHFDLLARESNIFHMHFLDAAFEMLKKSGAIKLVNSVERTGGWIMLWEQEVQEGKEVKEVEEKDDEAEDDENIQDKIIVRSNGTVTYVGKDIAYQLWKFG